MLKSPLFWKIVTLGGAMLLLLIPLTMVRQIIVERSDYRNDVEDAIRQSTIGPQKMVGPLIAIPVVALCGVMFLTRHLDWHSLAQPKPKPTDIPESQPAQSDEFRLWK